MVDLRGRVAIVTGGNSGIGRATAEGLVANGCEVIIASRNEKLGQTAVSEIRNRHPEASIHFEKLDLGSQNQVREFSEKYNASGRPLHILVLNAGANFVTRRLTDDAVPIQCQVNYLGHYTLTRLLEPILIKSAPSRIVSVSSATHRYGAIPSPRAFLSKPKSASYSCTKLAQVFFTYEAERRLGQYGVQACVIDPGGVKTNVWKGRYAKPPFSWYLDNFLAPPEDGAQAVLHAATADLSKEDTALQRRVPTRRQHLRFYSKGAFAAPFLTHLPPPTGRQPALDFFKDLFVKIAIGVASFIDYPVRNFSRGSLFAKVLRIPSASLSYDEIIAKQLWDESAELAKLSPLVVPAKAKKGSR